MTGACACKQEYYANTGALKRAAESARGGRAVGCSIVETFSRSVQPRELEQVLRLEYRSKLLNPKWAQVPPSFAHAQGAPGSTWWPCKAAATASCGAACCGW